MQEKSIISKVLKDNEQVAKIVEESLTDNNEDDAVKKLILRCLS